MKSKLILIAGGGTGGHIYPAIAIAQALKDADSQVYVEFVGTAQGLEREIVPREGFGLHLIPARALNSVSGWKKIFSMLLLPWGIIKSILLLLRLKPAVVLGVGGYASGPMMLAAVITGQKTALFEPNAYPGMTNRWLATFVNISFITFAASKPYFPRSHLLGMPVRHGLQPLEHQPSEKLKVLVFGGSQGARGINATVAGAFREAMKNNSHWADDFEIVHQIGARDWEKFDREYKTLGVKGVKWHRFLYDMPERYKWADLVVCRAGAATISELAACKKAAVLVPFAGAADDHQKKNAEALAHQGAAMMISQHEFTAGKFVDTLRYFNVHREKIGEFENAVRKFFIPDAAQNIAKEILKLGETKQ